MFLLKFALATAYAVQISFAHGHHHTYSNHECSIFGSKAACSHPYLAFVHDPNYSLSIIVSLLAIIAALGSYIFINRNYDDSSQNASNSNEQRSQMKGVINRAKQELKGIYSKGKK